MKAVLYWIDASHPSNTTKLALEHKGIDYELKDLLAGVHPLQLRAAGFKAGTVPAVKLDGRKVQGTLAIARALDELVPDPPLFPADPEQRRAVEEAERWGEAVLQPVPRRIIRHALGRDQPMREWFASAQGLPAAPIAGRALLPMAKLLGRQVGADEATVRRDLAELPAHMAHVDDLLAKGVIGGNERNAADFQIVTSVRFLLAQEDTRALVEGHPCADYARALIPSYPGPFPAGLPAEWSSASA